MKIALLFVLVATFLALAYSAPAAPEHHQEESLETVEGAEETPSKNKRNLVLGYGYPSYAYNYPSAYAYCYPSAYAYAGHPYSAYSAYPGYGYIYG